MKTSILAISIPLIMSAMAYASEATKSPQINEKEFGVTFGNKLVSDGIRDYISSGNAPEWLKTTDVQLRIGTGKPQYAIQTVQPLFRDQLVTNLVQFRLGNDSGSGTVANLGFGHRVMSKDKNTMYGVNAFFDHGFKYGHERVGLGGEYFWAQNEFRTNLYKGISKDKEVDSTNHIWERVLDGYDYEVGTAVPNAPWLKLFVGGYHWDYRYVSNQNGWKVRSELQVTDRLSLEAGTDKSHDKYVKLLYALGSQNSEAMFQPNKRIFRKNEVSSLENKRLQPITRNNNIEVERYAKDEDGVAGPMLNIVMSGGIM